MNTFERREQEEQGTKSQESRERELGKGKKFNMSLCGRTVLERKSWQPCQSTVSLSVSVSVSVSVSLSRRANAKSEHKD